MWFSGNPISLSTLLAFLNSFYQTIMVIDEASTQCFDIHPPWKCFSILLSSIIFNFFEFSIRNAYGINSGTLQYATAAAR